jgi:WD repeat-containing protein 1 (actin-interacting protein 1)
LTAGLTILQSGKSIFLRSIDDPSDVIQYTGHVAHTTVARFAPLNIRGVYKVASGDERGIVKVWEWIKANDDTEEDSFKAAGMVSRIVASQVSC